MRVSVSGSPVPKSQLDKSILSIETSAFMTFGQNDRLEEFTYQTLSNVVLSLEFSSTDYLYLRLFRELSSPLWCEWQFPSLNLSQLSLSSIFVILGVFSVLFSVFYLSKKNTPQLMRIYPNTWKQPSTTAILIYCRDHITHNTYSPYYSCMVPVD